MLEVGQTVRVTNPDLEAYGAIGVIVDVDEKWMNPYEIKFYNDAKFSQELYSDDDVTLVINTNSKKQTDNPIESMINHIDNLVEHAKKQPSTREVSIAITKLQEAKMWLKEVL